MMINSGTLVGGRYTILEKIGIGGMAVVYRAKDEKLDRFVTFKVLKEEFASDPEFIKKFSVEATAAARLNHSNIVSVYDFGNEGLIYYIVMEYIDGLTLKELINKRAPFENEEALGVAIQIASALEHAHKNNIVHRDIKPQNILVTKDGTIKVTDFGIARATTSSTVITDSVGSVHYFSPEQARGGFVDNKSDIYSLGIVLFEMVTGQLPFNGDSAVALAMKHISEPIPDMKTINPNISESIVQIILKATAKISTQRYPTIEALNFDLKKALSNSSGEFVERNNEFESTSPTVVITKDELDEIRSKSTVPEATSSFSPIKKEVEQPIEQEYYDEEYYDEEYYDEEYYDDQYSDEYQEDAFKDDIKTVEHNKKKERNVIIAAIVTAFAIIALITSFGVYFFNKNVNAEFTVPDFTQKTWEQAKQLAAQFEIYIEKEEKYDDDVKQDIVISQDIKQGTAIKKGDKVNVIVSLGTDKIVIPDVVGKEKFDAYSEFDGMELDIKSEDVFDNDMSIGVVVKQEPEGKEEVKKGSEVILYISKGAEVSTIKAPSVVGRSESEAKTILSNAGFTVKVTRSESDRVDEGYVISQGVKAGNEYALGYVAMINVSSGKLEVEEKIEQTTKAKEPITQAEKTTAEKTTKADNENSENDSQSEDVTEAINEEENKIKTATLTIDPVIDENAESVDVKISKRTGPNSTEVVYSGEHQKNEFPLNISVQGKEPTEYEMYINGEYKGSETKSFN